MGMRLNNKEESAAGTESALTGTQRRKKILALMRQTSHPLSGGALGRETGVSRQVVVQDIALLPHGRISDCRHGQGIYSE